MLLIFRWSSRRSSGQLDLKILNKVGEEEDKEHKAEVEPEDGVYEADQQGGDRQPGEVLLLVGEGGDPPPLPRHPHLPPPHRPRLHRLPQVQVAARKLICLQLGTLES